jgi:hypothetical protein
MRKAPAVILPMAALAALLLWGHVGSPTVFFDGSAGPFPVHVVIRPPGVIPGRAEIAIRVLSKAAALGVREVTVRPLQWDAGPAGAPPAEAAERVRGEPGLWTTELWLMTASSYDIEVHLAAVAGTAGDGEVEVPLSTARTQRLGMQRGLGVALTALGLFLFVGLLNLIGAGVRESTLPPGETASPGHRRRARYVTAGAAVLLGLALAGGKQWWDGVDRFYRQRLFKSFSCSAATRVEGGARLLDFVIGDTRWQSGEESDLLPDHGKLVHLFLVREPGLDGFAHLHPVRLDHSRFEAALPPLPAGTYRAYADITQESGFAETLTTTLRLPAPPPLPPPTDGAPSLAPDPDDSYRLSPALSIRPQAVGAISPLDGGLTMTWERGTLPLFAGREVSLRFAATNPDGSPAHLEPYMGMLGHAVVLREDGGVFVHLHPMGTVSTGAQEALTRRLHGDQAAAAVMPGMPGMPGMPRMPPGAPLGEVAFPYEFPAPGRYRIWVQVKSGGIILTGVFDTEVGRAG